MGKGAQRSRAYHPALRDAPLPPYGFACNNSGAPFCFVAPLYRRDELDWRHSGRPTLFASWIEKVVQRGRQVAEMSPNASMVTPEEAMAFDFKVNGKVAHSDAPPNTPLLWVIREELKLTGTKFGCGTGLCGACMVHIDGKRAFSCQTQVSQVAGKAVTTIEGLSTNSSHPVQKAWLAERVPQCGYCQSGQIMSAADLLAHNPKPNRSEIVEHMSTNICRCGSYPRIVRAIERAAKEA